MSDVSFDDWAACPVGAIQKVALRKKRRRRIRWMMTVSAVVGVLGLALFFSSLPKELPPMRHPIEVEYYYGGIACSEVISNLSAYIDHKLDAGTESRLDEHLRECAKCRTRFEQMSSTSASVTAPNRLLSASTNFGSER